MTNERELLRRALLLLDYSRKESDAFEVEALAYLDTPSNDAEEPTHMNFKGLTLEEMESCIKGNLTITDPNLREGVIASIIDAEHLLMEKNTNGDEPAALKEEE